ncbi:MAG: serine/threonine-protein kinase [Planctomycetia bacterium]|nr:serine/threonine-protein kinase [Planctomycetia bacterium]
MTSSSQRVADGFSEPKILSKVTIVANSERNTNPGNADTSGTNTSHFPTNEISEDASITRTLSPIYQKDQLLGNGPDLPDLKIDGDLLDLGMIFDEYELIRYIGGGGMGNVWLAQDSNLNRLVALKLLHSDKSNNAEVIQRFYSEAQVAAVLNHPNISQIYTFRDHRESKRMFLTMEYVPGENLRDRVKSAGPLSLEETVSIAIQISCALAHMAQRRIVHRDIKPSNILLTESGEAKLIDLGLARIAIPMFDATDETETVVPNDITASGVTLGTFDYISPEQARDPRTVDIRSDIYSLGCTLYYLLTGHPPFPQGNPLQKLLQHQSDNPMDVRMSRVDVPESLNAVLTRAMKKNPEERYSTPEEMIADLECTAQEIGLPMRNQPVYIHPTEHKAFSVPGAYHLWRQVLNHLFWLIPMLLLAGAVWFMQHIWTPTPGEMELPPAPGLTQETDIPETPIRIPSAETENITTGIPILTEMGTETRAETEN